MTQPKSIAQYELLEEIGRGGFATVYRARDTALEREVALKVLAGNFTREPAFVERFRREARTAANLQHPNIVPVYDFGEADGALYLAMTLVGKGRTLRDLLAEQGPLSLEHTLPILLQLAAALDHLHQQDPSLTHRDVKPSNVLLGGSAAALWVVLTDFGLVRSMEASTELTQSSTVLGSPAYMAPEQADHNQWGEITPLTDVYALGVVAYEMLTGRLPFAGEALTLMHAHAYDPPTSPLEFTPDLGDDLSTVLLRALAKPPGERYPTAGTFVTALQGAAGAHTSAAEREATLEQLEAQARELLGAGEWLEALDRCTQMVRLDPDRPAALEMLTAAKQGLDRERTEAVSRRHLAERYQAGLDLLVEQKWKQAITVFKEVIKGNPDFRDVQGKLVLAQDELQRAQWYDEAITHARSGRWVEACRIWLKVLRGRLDYCNGDAATHLLAATAGLLEQYEQAQLTRESLAHYDTLVTAVEGKDWETVIQISQSLLRQSPDLEHPQTWLSHARFKLKLREELGQDNIVWEQDGKRMVRVPAGKFLYGDYREERELPEFWIDKTPVTNTEFARFVKATGCEPPEHWRAKTPPRDTIDHPVTNVSWHDAIAYAEWAGKRLPTEEEWEKAARGDDGREYPWGDWKKGRCNSNEAGVGATTSVSQYSPDGDSPYGCVDMAGNVWEWTASDYRRNIKVLRGGSFPDGQRDVRASNRGSSTPSPSGNNVGFRCVVQSSGR